MTQTVEGQITLVDPAEGLAFRATNARGNSILLGSTPSEPQAAAAWTGVSPMEVVLLGLGGCTAIDVAGTLRKMRQDVTAYRVRVGGQRRETHPRIYTHIAVEHELHGRGLRETSVRRAIELSAGTYCSVSAMLEQVARVEISYRIVDADSGAETVGVIVLPPSPNE
jgi:putative redox protein